MFLYDGLLTNTWNDHVVFLYYYLLKSTWNDHVVFLYDGLLMSKRSEQPQIFSSMASPLKESWVRYYSLDDNYREKRKICGNIMKTPDASQLINVTKQKGEN